MRRFGVGLAAVATAAALLGVTPAPAASCVDGIIFKFCGDHVPADALPLRFKLNAAGKPSTVSEASLRSAVRGAAHEWNRHWPLAGRARGMSGLPGDCGFGVVAAVCFDDGTGATFDVGDGVNSIVFGNPTACPGGSASATATACLHYAGTNRIDEVDIILNSAKEWRWPQGAEALAAEPTAVYPQCEKLPTCVGSWFDVQSVLTHEIGHALGLEHVGSHGYPASLLETPQYHQSMYFRSYARSTSARTLNVGDILGLQLAARASASL